MLFRSVFKYYRFNKSPPVQLAMVSIGVMFVTQAVVRIIIGPSDRRFFDGEKFIIKAREFKEMTGLNEGLALKSTQVITIFVTIVLVSLLFWFLNKTKTGKSMKAYSSIMTLYLSKTIIASSFFFNDTATTEIYTLSLHDALPISWVTNITPILTIAS